MRKKNDLGRAVRSVSITVGNRRLRCMSSRIYGPRSIANLRFVAVGCGVRIKDGVRVTVKVRVRVRVRVRGGSESE